MKNQKYYCAWHPEKGILGLEYQTPKITTTSEDAEDLFFQEFGHLFVTQSWSGASFHLEAKQASIEYAKSQGWQVKEVVIVEKDEFDKLTKEAKDDKE